MSFTIFDIPEVIDSIAHHLTPHDLSICLRVNKTWYRDFLRLIWEDVHTYDFDFNHGEWSIFEPERYEGEDPDRDRYGRHNVAKYSHLIRSLTTRSLKSLIDLGPGCVNLRELSFGDYYTFRRHPDSSSGFQQWMSRSMDFEEHSTETWVQLLKRNPNLRKVKVMFSVADDQAMIVEALSELEHLEELMVNTDYGAAFQPSVLELVLQKCKSIKKLSFRSEDSQGGPSTTEIAWGRLENHPLIEEMVFEGCDALAYIRLLPGLKALKFRDLRGSWPATDARLSLEAVAPIVNRYCPRIEHLAFNRVQSPGVLEIVESCPSLKSFSFTNAMLDASIVAAVDKRSGHTLEKFLYQGPWTAPRQDTASRHALENALLDILGGCYRLLSFEAMALFDIDMLKNIIWSSSSLQEIGLSVEAESSREEGKLPLVEEPIEVQKRKVQEFLEFGEGPLAAGKWGRLKKLELWGVPGGLHSFQLAVEFSRIKTLIWQPPVPITEQSGIK